MAGELGRIAPGVSSKVHLAIDVAVLVSSMHVAFAANDQGASHIRTLALVTGLVAWLLAGTALRHYDPLAVRALFDDLAMVGVLVLSQVTVLAAFALTPELDLTTVGWFVAFALPLSLLSRVVMRHFLACEGPVEEVLIVGVGALGRATVSDLDRSWRRRRVAGHLSWPGEPPAAGFQGRLLGTSSDLARVLAEIPVEEVYLAGNPARSGVAMQAAIKVCETLGLPFALPQYCFRFDRAVPADDRDSPDGYNHFLPMEPKLGQHALKRLFDIVVCGAALWLLLPVLAVIAALVKLTSRGPIFYKQLRVGRFGRTFHMLKFRSMVVDAEEQRARLEALNEQSGPVFKISKDPRVTPLGRFLRRHSLDELPQILNVLRGDMSVVGPRPPLPAEVAQYQGWQRRRLSVRPGMTCIWQVSGRSQISFDEWMYLDMRYIDHWSLYEDLRLVLKTLPVVVNGRGAA